MHSFYYNFKSNILKILKRTIAARESTLPLKVQMKSNIFRNFWADYWCIRFNNPKKITFSNLTYLEILERTIAASDSTLPLKKIFNLKYLEILERTIAAPESTLPLKVQFQNRHLQHLHWISDADYYHPNSMKKIMVFLFVSLFESVKSK